jgi:hypothetical protein
MANPSIKIKRSSVAGKVPHYPSTIDVGEFAINTADGKVFIAAGVGAGVTVQEVGISTQHVLSSGIGTFGNETVVVGAAQTQFLVRGNGRVVGILTVGSGSVTLNDNSINVGAGTTILTSGFQIGGNGVFVHSTGYNVGNTFVHNAGLTGSGANLTGIVTCFGLDITGNSLAGNINSSGISTISGFTFPSSDGSEDQALVTDGSGSLSFKTLSGGGGAVGGATTISTSNTESTQGQTAFTAPNVFDDGEQATSFSVLVSVNGVKQRLGASNDYQLSAPQTVTFTSGLTAGDNAQINVYFGHTFEEEFFTSTQNQTTFTLAGNLAAAKNYRVFLNGVRLRRDIDYQASSAVVLTESCLDGDEVDICSDQAEDQLTAIAGQSSFAPSNSDTSSDNMEVYLNGVLLQRTVDWTIGNPAITIINPITGLDVGDELDVVVRRS